MNRYGSYLKLRDNSISALMAAIEIYNKPKFDYRDECFVILLINSWELALKAFLSKNKIPIYYPKEKNKPYRTLGILHAIQKSEKIWVEEIDFKSNKKNVELLIEIRNNSIHFYNENCISVKLYELAQTSIINYKDFLEIGFAKDITTEVTLTLLPLAFQTPVSPIKTLKKPSKNIYVNNFQKSLEETVTKLESENHDTGRLLSIFNIRLESVKKISSADFTVGIDNTEKNKIVHRRTDPNKTHPYRMKDIVSTKKNQKAQGMKIKYGETKLTSYVFQAIIFEKNICSNKSYCWVENSNNTKKYSYEFINFLKSLNEAQVNKAISQYKRRPQ